MPDMWRIWIYNFEYQFFDLKINLLLIFLILNEFSYTINYLILTSVLNMDIIIL